MKRCNKCNSPCDFYLCDICDNEEEQVRIYEARQDELARKQLTRLQYDKYLEGEYSDVEFTEALANG